MATATKETSTALEVVPKEVEEFTLALNRDEADSLYSVLDELYCGLGSYGQPLAEIRKALRTAGAKHRKIVNLTVDSDGDGILPAFYAADDKRLDTAYESVYEFQDEKRYEKHDEDDDEEAPF